MRLTWRRPPRRQYPLMNFRYIAIEGPIGVGKTSLARKIAAETNAQPVLEQPQENPFLERFYRDATRYALPTQMFFLFQRMNQLRDLTQTDLFSAPVVSDFLIDSITEHSIKWRKLNIKL